MTAILRSLWGKTFGLDVNDDLVLNGQKITNFGGGAAASVGVAVGTGVVAANAGGNLMRTRLTLTAAPVAITDDAGTAQYGGVTSKIFTFPVGMIVTFGFNVQGSWTLGTTGTIIATFGSSTAIGTIAATTGATLVSTEATYLQQFANATAATKVAVVDAVSVATQLTESGARWVDGTETAADMYLNLVVTDDATHTSGTGSFTGTVEFLWASLGVEA